MNWLRSKFLCSNQVLPDDSPSCKPMNPPMPTFYQQTHIVFDCKTAKYYDHATEKWGNLGELNSLNPNKRYPKCPKTDDLMFKIGSVIFDYMLIGPATVSFAKNVPPEYSKNTLIMIPITSGPSIALSFDTYAGVVEFIEHVERMWRKVKYLELNENFKFFNVETELHFNQLKKWIAQGRNEDPEPRAPAEQISLSHGK